MIALPWWQLLAGLLAAGLVGWTVDRLTVRRWLKFEADRAIDQLIEARKLEQEPDELARRIRDRGDVDGAVVFLTGLGVLAVVLIVQLCLRVGLL